MSLFSTTTGRDMIGGTARILLAEALFPVTALITAGFLTRRFGPEGYGLLALTLTPVFWIENAVNAYFSKATIKFVGATDDWRPLGAEIIRSSTLTGAIAMVALWLLATPLALLLGEPELAFYLRIGALDLPFFCSALAYRSVLVGAARYHETAVARAGRWLSRLCVIVLLVQAGLSLTGALCGIIASSVVEVAICYWFLGSLGTLRRGERKPWPFHRYGTLLFVSSVCLMAYSSLDLFMLKILGGTPAEIGVYNAAQGLALFPGLIAWTLSSTLLATLSRLLADNQTAQAQAIAKDGLRVTLWMIPLTGIVCGAAAEIVQVVFGVAFVPAALLFLPLIVGAAANLLLIVLLTIMIAHGRPRLTVAHTLPLVPLALCGHILAVPAKGAQGAAIVTLSVALLGTAAAAATVYRLWGIAPPLGAVLRSLGYAAIFGIVASLWITPGWWVLAKLAILGTLSVFAYWCAGEFTPLKSDWFWRKRAGSEAGVSE